MTLMTSDDKNLLFLLGRMILRNDGVMITAAEDREIWRYIHRAEMAEDRVRDEIRTEIAMRVTGKQP